MTSKRSRNEDKKKNRSNLEPTETVSFERQFLSPPNLKSQPDRKRCVNESVIAIKHDFGEDNNFEIKWSEANKNWLWLLCKDPKTDEKISEQLVGMEVQTIFGIGVVCGFRNSDHQMYEIRIENHPGKMTLSTMEVHRKVLHRTDSCMALLDSSAKIIKYE